MIPAIVLAAGLSRRMGRFKLTLAWGQTTVIGQVLTTLHSAGVEEIIVVTGHRADEVQAAALASGVRVRIAHNAAQASGEMLGSIQTGLAWLRSSAADTIDALGRVPSAAEDAELLEPDAPDPLYPAALLCLGDQPQLQASTVQAVLAAGVRTGWQRVIIPSFNMRAGHPILLPRHLWPAILGAQDSLRAVLAAHRDVVEYLTVETPSILADLDTPEDYERERSSCA